MLIKLAYGKKGYSINLSDNYNIDIIEPVWVNGVPDQKPAITEALRKPYNCKPLKEIITKEDGVAVIFSDITRATPYNIIMPSLLDELQDVPKNKICFFCANGTHRLLTGTELITLLGERFVNEYEIVQNVATDKKLFEYVGTTSSGNAILLNKKILDYKVKILTGFIEPHFFAGFSGGGKALIPGLVHEKTIKYNHSVSHLSHKNAKWGMTYGNPLWEEIMEAAELVPGLFLLNVTLNKEKEITNVFAGDLRTAHNAGCQFVKESAMVPVDKLYDIVITSNSGYPLDLNVYQSVKGMSAAAQIVKEGGHIIVAAECWDGVPPNSDYELILGSVNSPDELLDFINEKEDSLRDTWQIYIQGMIQKKAKVYLYSDKLDDNTIKKTLLNPVPDICSLVDELIKKTGSDTRICVLPEGPHTIPYLKS